MWPESSWIDASADATAASREVTDEATSCHVGAGEISLPEQIYLREAYEPGENRQLLIGGEAAHSGAAGSQQPARAESQDNLLHQLMAARRDQQKPERAPPVAGVGESRSTWEMRRAPPVGAVAKGEPWERGRGKLATGSRRASGVWARTGSTRLLIWGSASSRIDNTSTSRRGE
eukprot:s223_g4.t1